jgi:hypothetical protein
MLGEQACVDEQAAVCEAIVTAVNEYKFEEPVADPWEK